MQRAGELWQSALAALRIPYCLAVIQAWVLRLYYRLINYWNWRNSSTKVSWDAMDIPAGDRSIRCRHYTAQDSANKPLIVYFHGGGWTIGDLVSHHPFCCELSARAGCTVIAVDYALAPERPFPAGPEDCLAAAEWIAKNRTYLGASNGQLVLAGDSAGGNLALATCLALTGKARQAVAGVCAIYPGADHYNGGYPSYVERATGQTLTTRLMIWFWDTYLGGLDPNSAEAQRAFPTRSENLAELPPTLLVSAEYDPLRDEDKALAERLKLARVPLVYHHYDSAAHGFACSEGPTPDFLHFMDITANWVRGLS